MTLPDVPSKADPDRGAAARHRISGCGRRRRERATNHSAVERGFRRVRERPYTPGWLDRLRDRIDRAPGPDWLWALGLLALETAWVLAMLWLSGSLREGFDLSRIFVVAIAPYIVWVRFYLDRVAARAMDAFRPALAVSDEEFARLRYELVTLPAPLTRIATVVAVVGYVVNAALLPDRIIAQFGPSRVLASLMLAPVAIFTLAVVVISTAQAVRQLWMVGILHGLAEHVNLFRVKPFYAFSGLAARTGMSFLVLAYLIVALRPDIVRDTPALQLLIVAMVPTAIACFVLPLYGMHERLVAEKDRLLAEANGRFEMLLARLHARVDEEILTDAEKISHQLSSLATERETIARLSTWPWDATTMTGFLTTLVLPLLIWLVQRLLGRFGV